MSEYNLKPCVLCGHNDMCLSYRDGTLWIEEWFVFCNDCRTSFGNESVEHNKDKTIEWWNNL